MAALGILFVVHELRMFGAGTVAGFAIHAKDEARRIESSSRGGSSGVTAKATAQSIRINAPAHCHIQGWRLRGQVAGGHIQPLQTLEETHAALVERAIALIHESLALVP